MAISPPTADFVTSSLVEAIDASQTTMTIAAGKNIPATNGALQIDYNSAIAVAVASGPETILYTAYNTGTGAVSGMTRGAGGTTGVTHANLAAVQASDSSVYYSALNALYDGWIEVTNTWAYASATTITVPAGAATKYSVGDKIKLTANSVILYAYIVTVADTLLTVAGNALTNHTFTANYYSKSTSPVGFPQWFAWTPTISLSGAGTAPTYTTNNVNRFSITGRKVTCNIYMSNSSGGTAGSGTTQVLVSYPVTASSVYTTRINILGSGMVFNNTTETTYFVVNDSTITFEFGNTAGELTADGQNNTSRQIRATFTYEI